MVRWTATRVGATACLLAVTLVCGRPATADVPTEYELKAIFLFNFTKYVEWEADPPRHTLSVCVLGQDPFGEILDGTIEGETVQGRRLLVRRIDTVPEALSCQVVFLGESEESRLEPVLDALADRTVLTVGETDAFTERGGIIRLREDGSRIRIVINTDAAKRAGLRISSQLLKLGDVVGGGK